MNALVNGVHTRVTIVVNYLVYLTSCRSETSSRGHLTLGRSAARDPHASIKHKTCQGEKRCVRETIDRVRLTTCAAAGKKKTRRISSRCCAVVLHTLCVHACTLYILLLLSYIIKVHNIENPAPTCNWRAADRAVDNAVTTTFARPFRRRRTRSSRPRPWRRTILPAECADTSFSPINLVADFVIGVCSAYATPIQRPWRDCVGCIIIGIRVCVGTHTARTCQPIYLYIILLYNPTPRSLDQPNGLLAMIIYTHNIYYIVL